MSDLREALAGTIWWGKPEDPATWCWCDDFCGGKDYGCAAARAALAAPGEGRAERIEKAARGIVNAWFGDDGSGDAAVADHHFGALRAALDAAPASPEPREVVPVGVVSTEDLASGSTLRHVRGQTINEATAIGLDLAADLLASWWDDGEQTPKGFNPQTTAEVVMLRSQAKKMRDRAASPEPEGEAMTMP